MPEERTRSLSDGHAMLLWGVLVRVRFIRLLSLSSLPHCVFITGKHVLLFCLQSAAFYDG